MGARTGFTLRVTFPVLQRRAFSHSIHCVPGSAVSPGSSPRPTEEFHGSNRIIPSHIARGSMTSGSLIRQTVTHGATHQDRSQAGSRFSAHPMGEKPGVTSPMSLLGRQMLSGGPVHSVAPIRNISFSLSGLRDRHVHPSFVALMAAVRGHQ